jgi:hypothetical protein
MDIFLQDPNDVPLPPDEVRIQNFSAEPYPDQRRIRVKLTLTPFQKRPHVKLVIYSPAGENLSEVSILESMTKNMDLTMHLRTAQPPGAYQLDAIIYYLQESDVDDAAESQAEAKQIIVDRHQVTFHLGNN